MKTPRSRSKAHEESIYQAVKNLETLSTSTYKTAEDARRIASEALRVIHVRRLFGNEMRLIQLQASVSTYCYHSGSNGPGSEKPWIDSTFV